MNIRTYIYSTYNHTHRSRWRNVRWFCVLTCKPEAYSFWTAAHCRVHVLTINIPIVAHIQSHSTHGDTRRRRIYFYQSNTIHCDGNSTRCPCTCRESRVEKNRCAPQQPHTQRAFPSDQRKWVELKSLLPMTTILTAARVIQTATADFHQSMAMTTTPAKGNNVSCCGAMKSQPCQVTYIGWSNTERVVLVWLRVTVECALAPELLLEDSISFPKLAICFPVIISNYFIH